MINRQFIPYFSPNAASFLVTYSRARSGFLYSGLFNSSPLSITRSARSLTSSKLVHNQIGHFKHPFICFSRKSRRAAHHGSFPRITRPSPPRRVSASTDVETVESLTKNNMTARRSALPDRAFGGAGRFRKRSASRMTTVVVNPLTPTSMTLVETRIWALFARSRSSPVLFRRFQTAVE